MSQCELRNPAGVQQEHMLPTEQAKALADEALAEFGADRCVSLHHCPQGRDFSDQAGNIFRELGDKEGLQMVDEVPRASQGPCARKPDEVMYLASNVAVERYCEA